MDTKSNAGLVSETSSRLIKNYTCMVRYICSCTDSYSDIPLSPVNVLGLLKKAYGSNVPLTMIWGTVQEYFLMTVHLYKYEKVDTKML